MGLATVAGINAHQKSQKQSAIDHITQKAIEIATDVQVYAHRSSMYRSENTTGDQDLVVDFGELSHYEPNDSSHEGDHVDAYATYSLSGHSTLPERYTPEACLYDSPINTVEAYSRAHDVSVCVSITGPSAEDLKVGVGQ